jgi:hypothetical protein
MQPAVAPIGDGKHDHKEDEGADKLKIWDVGSFNADVCSNKMRVTLTSSKKQLADDM